MADGKKTNWAAYGYYISVGGVILFSLLSILRIHYDNKISSIDDLLTQFSVER